MEQKIWWYSLNNEQKGPVSEAELNMLVDQKFMQESTPVWKEGLENWIAYRDINAPVDNSPKRPPLPAGFGQATAAPQQNRPSIATQNMGFGQQAPAYAQAGSSQSNYSQPNFNGQAQTASPQALNAVTDIYYRAEFEKILNSNETYKGKFNWWAFFFNWVWGFTKGLWQYSVLILIVMLAANYFLPIGVGQAMGLGIAIFYGMRGTYLYYNVKMKNKQLF